MNRATTNKRRPVAVNPKLTASGTKAVWRIADAGTAAPRGDAGTRVPRRMARRQWDGAAPPSATVVLLEGRAMPARRTSSPASTTPVIGGGRHVRERVDQPAAF